MHIPIDGEWLKRCDSERIASIFESKSASFSDLVKTAGFDRTTDFRYSDLSGVDFAGSDIRGFDFTGANLCKTRWLEAKWDNSTLLTGAQLDKAEGYNSRNVSEEVTSFEEIAQAVDDVKESSDLSFLAQEPETSWVSGLSGRYAVALFELASEEAVVEEVVENLNRFDELMIANSELMRLVRSPVFGATDQMRAVTQILTRAGIDGLTKKFLMVLITNRRLFAISDIRRSFGVIVSKRFQLVGNNGRFAKVLFDLARVGNSLEQVERDLLTFSSLMRESEDLVRVLHTPIYTKEDKVRVLSILLDRAGIQNLTAKFLKILVTKRQRFDLNRIIGAFTGLVDENRVRNA
jgi:F0F1-type ATP synthase delta subunit